MPSATPQCALQFPGRRVATGMNCNARTRQFPRALPLRPHSARRSRRYYRHQSLTKSTFSSIWWFFMLKIDTRALQHQHSSIWWFLCWKSTLEAYKISIDLVVFMLEKVALLSTSWWSHVRFIYSARCELHSLASAFWFLTTYYSINTL